MNASSRQRRAGPALAIAAILLLGAAEGGDPVDPVRHTLTRARSIVGSDATREVKLASLREAADGLFDTRTMAWETLPEALPERSEAQRREFVRLYDEVILRAYLQKLLLFRDPRFAYAGQRVEGDLTFVRTRIVTEKDTYRVDYAMHRNGTRWQATDIVIEGISLKSNYRDQLQSLLERQSFEDMLARMRRKVGERPVAGGGE